MSPYKPLTIIMYPPLPYTSASSPPREGKDKKQTPEEFYNTKQLFLIAEQIKLQELLNILSPD
jgi:hypothetical protein